MNIPDSPSYSVSLEVSVPAEEAFRYLSDPEMLGRWALGCFNTQPGEEGLYKGTSLFDGLEVWFHIDADPTRLLIDYHVGGPENRLPRISTRVVSGPLYGRDSEHCIVTMTAWRTTDMSDARWQRLCASHDAEIFLIQAQLESRASQKYRRV
jgi:uncharacterized protein YndB with AHSA1/START domain